MNVILSVVLISVCYSSARAPFLSLNEVESLFDAPSSTQEAAAPVTEVDVADARDDLAIEVAQARGTLSRLSRADRSRLFSSHFRNHMSKSGKVCGLIDVDEPDDGLEFPLIRDLDAAMCRTARCHSGMFRTEPLRTTFRQLVLYFRRAFLAQNRLRRLHLLEDRDVFLEMYHGYLLLLYRFLREANSTRIRA
jgi:hypothetical protein